MRMGELQREIETGLKVGVYINRGGKIFTQG
jgi:hypothetical protein